MDKITFCKRWLKKNPGTVSFLTASTLIIVLCLICEPRWETNDDVAMSMVAHGYGIASFSSHHLIFTNVLWGYLIRAIPHFEGITGYATCTLITLLIVGWAVLYFLLRLSVGYCVGALVLVLLVTRPTVYPQFTINAGLLTVTAIIGFHAYARLGRRGFLIIAWLLAFIAYLIRSQEFSLMLAVALPLLPWKVIRDKREVHFAVLLLGVAIVVAIVFDRWSYATPEWQTFIHLNSARAPFTDFGAAERIKGQPWIMARYGYSANDIDLIKSWFFVDPQIANPNSLNGMLSELEAIPTLTANIQSGVAALNILDMPVLLPLVLPAIILFGVKPSYSVLCSWILCIGGVFLIGLLGRPGIIRIYVPLICLLLIAPLLMPEQKNKPTEIILFVLFVGCVGVARILIPEALDTKRAMQRVKEDIQNLPRSTVFTWGEQFPYELAFPVLSKESSIKDIQLYSLGVFTHAPFSVAMKEERAGRGLVDLLKKGERIDIVAGRDSIQLLNNYCNEHLNGNLKLESAFTYEARAVPAQRVRCEVAPVK